tara:strand:+ start:1922 stop:2935 length:1014 start_codon:yes stop_codon:yes gene_type:complete
MIKQIHFEKLLKIKKNEENIIKIGEFLNKNFINFHHSFEYKFYPFESLNIFKILSVYGYGNCKHFSILFKFLMDTIGVKCEIIYGDCTSKFVFCKKSKIQNHVYNIVEYNRRKYIIDTSYGIIKYKGKLIEYKNSLDKEVFSHFYNKQNPHNHYDHFNSNFIHVFDKKFGEKFSIENKKFPYKKKMSEYFSDLYFLQIPIFNRKFKEKKLNINKVIIKNKVKKLKNNTKKVTNIYSTNFRVNDNYFNINNFPYLIINVRVNSNVNGKFQFCQNNRKKSFNLNNNIFKDSEYFPNPIYSFSIISKKKIQNIEIIYTKSLLQKKFINFIYKISKNKKNK